MIDEVILYVAGRDIDVQVTDKRKQDKETWVGHIGNMKVSKKPHGLYLTGSLAKYLHGENITPLTMAGVEAAIKKIELDTGLDLSKAVVSTVAVGYSYIVEKDTEKYLRLFGEMPRCGMQPHIKSGRMGSVSYYTPVGSYKFIAYNKGGEVKKIPPGYEDLNVLRLEYKITKRKGIRDRIGRDITAYDLFGKAIYEKLVGAYYTAYRSISKKGRQVFTECMRPLSGATLTKWAAYQYWQDNPGVFCMLSGGLSQKAAARLRAGQRKMDNDITKSKPSRLIAELDFLVGQSAKNRGIAKTLVL
jgi:hypothetical protein